MEYKRITHTYHIVSHFEMKKILVEKNMKKKGKQLT